MYAAWDKPGFEDDENISAEVSTFVSTLNALESSLESEDYENLTEELDQMLSVFSILRTKAHAVLVDKITSETSATMLLNLSNLIIHYENELSLLKEEGSKFEGLISTSGRFFSFS